jgi:predicted nucleotidyltransferase component of viral defense system
MIPESFVESWGERIAPWQTLAMVEQDLVISRALVDLFNNDIVKNNLVFRGGTALNKLYLKPPARYSEDIDFVQTRAESIGVKSYSQKYLRKNLKIYLTFTIALI